MIDLNTLVSNALIAAVQQAVAPLNERIATLEGICATQHEAMVAMRDRIAALENNPAQGVDTQAAPTTGLTRDEVEALIEAKMDLHLECYDHDNYDEIASKVDDLPDLDDYVTRDEVRSEIEDVLNNATLSLSI
jgi:hypothetical protein